MIILHETFSGSDESYRISFQYTLHKVPGNSAAARRFSTPAVNLSSSAASLFANMHYILGLILLLGECLKVDLYLTWALHKMRLV